MANPHLNGLTSDKIHGRTANTTTIPSGKTLLVAGTLSTTGAVTVAAGTHSIALTDNVATVFSIAEAANSYIKIDTTDNSELVTISQRLVVTDGVASGTAKRVGGLQTALSAAGTALTASLTETVLTSATLPANTLKLGSIVRIKYQGIISATTGATTLTVKLRFGTTTLTGTTLISGTATTTASNLVFSGSFDLCARAAPGATAAVVGNGLFCEPTAVGTVTPKQAILASTNFATNGALLVELTGTWSANDVNSCRADMFTVEVI